ncbi:RNA methyltransferase [Candidatus Woesearchaeota archaeon]|nr:RNA methyltransferase [Candidatus Woesearchaeota archaeon]
MITVILMQPEHPGNVGAVARTMANFGCARLHIVEPQIDCLHEEAFARAKHAGSILKRAKIINKSKLKDYDLLIGTSAKDCSDYNIPRTPMFPDELAEQLAARKGNIGILFGREGCGLTNEEVLLCDILVTIPATKQYPVLNLSHAVNIVLYEMYKNINKKNRQYTLPTPEEKNTVEKKLNYLLDQLEFSTEVKRETQKKFWKKHIGKSMMTKRELYVLLGFLKKVKEKIQSLK